MHISNGINLIPCVERLSAPSRDFLHIFLDGSDHICFYEVKGEIVI